MTRRKRPNSVLTRDLQEIQQKGILSDYFSACVGMFCLLQANELDDFLVEGYEEYLYSVYLPDDARTLIAASDQERITAINLLVREWNEREDKTEKVWNDGFEGRMRLQVYGQE